jgi:hypothetical protein
VRARAAWVALSCLLVLGIYFEVYFERGALRIIDISGIQRVPHNSVDLSTELCHPLRGSGENVSVSSDTPDIEEFFFSLHRQQVVIQNESSACADGLMGADQGECGHAYKGEVKIFRQHRVSEHGVDVDLHFNRLCISAIFQNRSYVVKEFSQPICIATPYPRKICDADIGSLSRDKGSPRYITGIFGGGNGFPHVTGLRTAGTPSDYPETDSRNREDSGKSDKPKSEIGYGIIARLFPKSVFLFFIGGCGFGRLIAGGVLLWGHIQYTPNKATPQRKTHDGREERPK